MNELADGVSATDMPLVQMRGITKSFPGVDALRNVDLDLYAGEVLALLGENGAGKSTLIKILGGAHAPDKGSLQVHGASEVIAGPVDARRLGISVIYQEFNLVPALSVQENLFLGRERTRLGFLRKRQERAHASSLFKRIGVVVDSDALCRSLSVAQQQVVEIAKALAVESRVIIMDEPSAALSPREVDRLFAVIRELKAQGIGILYVTHRLGEVMEIADRAMVLRDGGHVETRSVSGLTREAIIEMMVGRRLSEEFPKKPAAIGGPRLVARNLKRGAAVKDVSLEVNRGEILALTGLVGAGRTETARLIFGADRMESGSVNLDGEKLAIRNPRDAINAGICLLTEDRKQQGLVLGMAVIENFGLPNMRRFAPWGWISQLRERRAMDGHVDRLQVKISSRYQQAQTLSGGNQQKVVLAKWLERNAEVIIFDEPTRGIDVGAKYEIYQLLNHLADQGKAILMITSELPEALGMADRILVMREGRINGEIREVSAATQEQIMELAVE